MKPTNVETYEFRIRRYGDLRRWEDIPVDHAADFGDGLGATTHALIDIKKPDPTVREVRYNEQGSLQGYYYQ